MRKGNWPANLPCPYTETETVTPSELQVNGATYRDDLLEGFTEHFSTLATPTTNPNFDEAYSKQVEADVKAIHETCSKLHSAAIPITKYEVSTAISKLKNKKAKDEDELISENLKLAGPHLSSFLIVFNNAIGW